MIRLLLSYLLLAWQLLLHLVRLRPLRRRAGLAGLVRRFAPEALLPYDPLDQEMFGALAHCEGCGLCDTGCALQGRLPFGAFGPSYLVLSLSRSLPLLDAGRSDLALFRDCSSCAACNPWCPKEIPIDQVPGWATGLLARLDEARSRHQPAALPLPGSAPLR